MPSIGSKTKLKDIANRAQALRSLQKNNLSSPQTCRSSLVKTFFKVYQIQYTNKEIAMTTLMQKTSQITPGKLFINGQ